MVLYTSKKKKINLLTNLVTLSCIKVMFNLSESNVIDLFLLGKIIRKSIQLFNYLLLCLQFADFSKTAAGLRCLLHTMSSRMHRSASADTRSTTIEILEARTSRTMSGFFLAQSLLLHQISVSHSRS